MMDMNSLLHRAPAPSIDNFRSAATNNMSSYQNPSLPGLRTHHLPSLPIRLAALHSTTNASSDQHQRTDLIKQEHHLAQSHQATSLAPLRFIIPSSHCAAPVSSYSNGSASTENTVNIRPAGASAIKLEGKLSINTSRAYSNTSTHSQDGSYHSSRGSESGMGGLSHSVEADVLRDLGAEDRGKSKKSPGKRNRIVKNPNRSTKSKARPGLRKGKWTEEEERYATQLTNYFKEGLLPIERGTMLRLYLSQKLNCEPMRITKKFTGGECIGKQVFRPCSPTPESRIRLMQAQLELVALEAAFIKKLKENKEEVPGLTDDGEGYMNSDGLPMESNLKKRRPRGEGKRSYDDEDGDENGFSSDSSSCSDLTISASQQIAHMKRNVDGMDDASAVGLLLDFFYKASNRNESENGSEASSTYSNHEEVTTPDAEPEPETDDLVGPMKSTMDELASSPIKRMRTLSISNCVTDVTSPKRSRVGSFTLMATN